MVQWLALHNVCRHAHITLTSVRIPAAQFASCLLLVRIQMQIAGIQTSKRQLANWAASSICKATHTTAVSIAVHYDARVNQAR